MTPSDIAHQRLQNQRIAGPPFATPEEVVRWLGAVQAQEYAGAKWAVAQRARGVTDAAMDRAFADGALLRTHLLRPTWHFVIPADIRWMLALTAPRVHGMNAHAYRTHGLDDAVFARSDAALARALEGSAHRTRSELMSVLQDAGIATGDGVRSSLLMMHAELEGIVCSGPRRGKQFTYALLDERAPHTRALERDEALAELTARYFTSRGPATLNDYMWWSGLTKADARAGIAHVSPPLMHEVVSGTTYWFAMSTPTAVEITPTAYLLPNYDEYIVGYADRGAVWDARHGEKLDARRNPLFNHTIVVDGQVVGTWTRSVTTRMVAIEATLFTPLNDAARRALVEAAGRYGAFINLPVQLRLAS